MQHRLRLFCIYATMPFLGASAISNAHADLALATARNCMACHTVERKVVGPPFRAVAEKYAGQNVTEALATKIVKGGGGVWGAVPMPANSQVSDVEARKLAAWVLSLK